MITWQAGKSPFFMGDTSSNAGCLSIFIVVFAVVNSEKMEAEKLEVFKISRCHQRFFFGQCKLYTHAYCHVFFMCFMNSQPQKINTLNHDTCHGLRVQFSTCQSLQYTRLYTNIAVEYSPFEGVLLVHQGGKLLPYYILTHEQNLYNSSHVMSIVSKYLCFCWLKTCPIICPPRPQK